MLKHGLFWSLLFISLQLSANTQLQKRMEMLDKLDMLDSLDFIEAIDEANACIKRRRFSCASDKIDEAKDLAETDSQLRDIRDAKDSLYDEKRLVKRERAERKRRIEQRELEERNEKREKKRKREELRLAKEQREIESDARAKQWEADYDKRMNDHFTDLNNTLQTSQNEINRAVRQSQYEKAQRKQEKIDSEYAKQAEKERRDRLEQEHKRERIAEARQERVKDKMRQEPKRARYEREEIVQAKQAKERAKATAKAKAKAAKKYILAIESVAFCWHHKKRVNDWQCKGPTQLTVKHDPGLLEQAEMSGCQNPSNNVKQAWSSGDKQGYVMHCQTPMRTTDHHDIANIYGMPNYIRVKRKVYKCSHPLQANCKLHSTGQGAVANWRVVE